MGTKDQNQIHENFALPETDAAAPADDQPTAALEDVVVVEDIDGAPRSGDRATVATTPMEAEEVFVILPEGDTGNVPVVETQVVEESDEVTEHAIPVDASLQQIQEELDDDLLSEVSSPSDLREPFEGDSQDTETDLQEPAIEIDGAAAGSRRSWLRVALTAAAALALGVGGALYYFPLIGETGSNAAVVKVSPVVAPTVVSTPEPEPGNGSSPPGHLAVEAKEAFRAKLQLAIRLGFGGEAHR